MDQVNYKEKMKIFKQLTSFCKKNAISTAVVGDISVSLSPLALVKPVENRQNRPVTKAQLIKTIKNADNLPHRDDEITPEEQAKLSLLFASSG
jgi:hypothetical protein